MTFRQTKIKMLNYVDFYGGEIMYMDDIEKAKTKKELLEILERYRNHLRNVAIDAETHLDNFKIQLGLNLL